MQKDKIKKVIIILSAGIKKDKDGEWVSTDFIEPKNFAGSLGGKVRVIAASYIYKDNPKNFIIASGGYGFDKNILDINIEKDAITRYKKEIRIDDITIKGPMKSFADNVSIKIGNDNTYSIIIKGTTKPRVKIVK